MKPISNRGFTILETILAVAIFAMIGVLAARFLLATTRSATQVRRSTQAATLRDMVFEQYQAYGAVNFFTLDQLNRTDGSPKDFFNMSDNFGYDGFKITTAIDYGTSRSSCTLNGSLKWREGGEEKALLFSRVFTPLNILPTGADVRVQALSGTIGVSGLQVSAPTVDGSSNTATTDITGSALLRGVITGDAVAITIAGGLSNFDGSSAVGNPTGYFLYINNTYITDITTVTRIDPNHLNLIVVNNYQPARRITGRVINDDDPAEVAGQQVSLDTSTLTLVYSNGQFKRCGVDIQYCRTYTDPQGQYNFMNVIASSGSLFADGSWGSHPNMPPSNPSFRYGYTYLAPVDYVESDWNVGGYPQLNADLHVKRKGSWVITPTVGGAPLPLGMPASVKVNVAANRMSENDIAYYGDIDPVSRSVTFYNTVFSNHDHSTFYAASFPPPDPGKYGRLDWSCTSGSCLGVPNPFPMPIDDGYQLNIQLVDQPANLASNIDHMQLWSEVFLGHQATDIFADSSGLVHMPSYTPLGAVYFTGDPTVPYDSYINLWKASLLINGTLDGTSVDDDTNQFAPHVYVNSNYPGGPMQSDNAGHFSMTGFPYTSENHIHIVCDNAARTCQPSPSGGMNIDTSITTGAIYDPYMGGWVLVTHPQVNVQAGQSSPIQVRAKLVKYKVIGTVMDLRSGQPAAGLNLIDGYTNTVVATTQSDGSYVAWLTVSGRSSSARGQVSIGIPAQTVSSIVYPLIPTVQLPIPVTPDPNMVPLIQSFAFDTNGGGGV